jgi:hypothetical protein
MDPADDNGVRVALAEQPRQAARQWFITWLKAIAGCCRFVGGAYTIPAGQLLAEGPTATAKTARRDESRDHGYELQVTKMPGGALAGAASRRVCDHPGTVGGAWRHNADLRGQRHPESDDLQLRR